MPHDMPQDWNVFPSAGPLGVCALVVLVPLALEKSVSVANGIQISAGSYGS